MRLDVRLEVEVEADALLDPSVVDEVGAPEQLELTPGSPDGDACAWLAKATAAYRRLRDRAGLTGEAVDRAASAERAAARCPRNTPP